MDDLGGGIGAAWPEGGGGDHGGSVAIEDLVRFGEGHSEQLEPV